MAGHRCGWPHKAAPPGLDQPHPVSCGVRNRLRARGRRTGRHRFVPADHDPAARTARPAISSAARFAVGVLPVPARRSSDGDLVLLGGLLPLQRGRAPRSHLFPVSRVPGGDGDGADRRRRVCVHGCLGVHGAGVVFPGDDRSPNSGDSPRGLFVSRDRAHRRAGDPPVLRHPAGRQRCLHVYRNARTDPHRPVAVRRILPGARRLRRQGRPAAAARLAARGAPRRPFPSVGTDERRDAEDGHLR